MTRRLLRIAALACFGALPQAQADPLADGLVHCAAETDQSKRLACFDALAATVPKVKADQFGLTAEIQHKRDPGSEHQEDKVVLPGKIVALRQVASGEFVFTLDNQQVWMQAEIDQRFRFAVGDAVHIEHGSMGSLWLAADKSRKTRVKRIS
jgi:hypothetical protein